MQIFKKLELSVDFLSRILINSLASGGSTPELPTNAYFQIFLYFYRIFAKNWINFEKIAKFPLKLSKICTFH